MVAILYHFTTREGARQIEANGFSGLSCWLSPDVESIFGEAGRSVLLEVTLNLAEDELKRYAQQVTEETDIWDETVGDFVPEPGSARHFVWYEVPVNVVVTAGRIRRVLPHERRRLFAGLSEDD